MGAVGEHLRKRVEELESELQARAKFLAEREARQRVLEQRVEHVSAECFRIAQAFVESTKQPILLQMHRKIGPARFRIRAGSAYSVVGRLTEDGWELVTYLNSGMHSTPYATDEQFMLAAPPVLEELIGDALVTVMTGRDLLSPAAASRTKESFWVPWQRMFGARAARRPAHRTT